MKKVLVRISFGLLAGSCMNGYALADCTPSPDCATLGYNKSDTGCNGASFVRCPFDTTKVACLVSVSCADSKDGLITTCPSDWICTQQNFGGNVCYKKTREKTCEERNLKTCGSTCIATTQCCTSNDCSSGYVCNTSTHACEESKTCAVGDIYYSDKTCSTDLISGKTPIGVVGYISNGGKNGVVVALDTSYDNKSGKGIQWGCYGTDLSLTNYTSQSSAKNDYSGKTNTQKIMNECSARPIAASYCNGYTKGGVSGWYLPAYGELYAILYTNFSTVNTGLGKVSSNNQITSGYWYWSSSEYTSSGAWLQHSGNTSNRAYGKYYANYVRCVLAF